MEFHGWKVRLRPRAFSSIPVVDDTVASPMKHELGEPAFDLDGAGRPPPFDDFPKLTLKRHDTTFAILGRPQPHLTARPVNASHVRPKISPARQPQM